MTEDMRSRVNNLLARSPQARTVTLRTLALAVQGEAQNRTPVDTGALKSSAVTSVDGDTATVAFTQEYAADVHEDLTAHHDVGQAKFLEAALHQVANSEALQIIADEYFRSLGGSP